MTATAQDLSVSTALSIPPYARFIKRDIDMLAGIMALPFLALGLIISWCAYRATPLVSQKRVGLGRREYDFYQIRTNLGGRENFLGRLLRQTAIDELGEAINLLNGTMSLVGPRPMSPADDASYRGRSPLWDLRYLVKPGLCGLAIGRETNRSRVGATPGQTGLVRLRHDLEYISQWSWWKELLAVLVSIKDTLHGHDPRKTPDKLL